MEEINTTNQNDSGKNKTQFWLLIVLSAFLIITFVYYLPLRFQFFISQDLDDHATDGMNVSNEDHAHDGTEDANHGHAEPLFAAALQKLPLRAPADSIDRLPFVVKDGVKEFRLTADEFRWEYAKGKWVRAWGYNGQIPGPEIRMREGDRVRVIVKNNLPDGTSVHWHGIDVPWKADGVPGVTQDPIEPGGEFTYEFTATPAGTHLYHSHGEDHTTSAQQMDMGLSGSFIVEPKIASVAYDREYTLMLDEWKIGTNGENMALSHMHESGMMNPPTPRFNTFTINGRLFPDTKPLLVKKGERVLIRMINAGTAEFHPMHLHGHNFDVVAYDGNALSPAQRERRNTSTLHPGETVDILVQANNPGIWAFHCHQVHHAASGMIVVLQYEGFDPKKSSLREQNDFIASIAERAGTFFIPSASAHGDLAPEEDTHDAVDNGIALPKPIKTSDAPAGINSRWWTLFGISLVLIAALSFGVKRFLKVE